MRWAKGVVDANQQPGPLRTHGRRAEEHRWDVPRRYQLWAPADGPDFWRRRGRSSGARSNFSTSASTSTTGYSTCTGSGALSGAQTGANTDASTGASTGAHSAAYTRTGASTIARSGSSSTHIFRFALGNDQRPRYSMLARQLGW